MSSIKTLVLYQRFVSLLRKWLFMICSAVISFVPMIANSNGNVFEQRIYLNLASKSEVKTAYVDFYQNEYKFSIKIRGGGGAIALLGNDLILAAADGRFLKVNPRDWSYVANYLPSLNLGADKIKKSKRITYQELLPRVHDIFFHAGTWYVSYDEYSETDDRIYFVLAKKSVSNKGWVKIYKSPPLDVPYYAMGNGGKIAYYQDKIFFTVGDYSLDRINHLASDVAPQNPNLPWGKVNFLDLKSNGFHVFTLGHRNPTGLLALNDGRLIESENGPQGGDELNLLKEGRNYGWPYESYGTVYGSHKEYRDSLIVPRGNVYESPVYSFVPSVAPSSLVQIKDFDKRWDGDILLGSLKAMSLFHIRIADRVVFSEPIFINRRVRDLKQLGSRIFILTDDC